MFKMVCFHVKRFHNKSRFYCNFKKYWVVQTSFPIVEKLAKINHKNAKKASTFDLSTFYTTIPHNLLIKVLNEIISFVFNYKKKTQARFYTGHPKEVTNNFLHNKV